jgi:hypothetical protein
MNRVGLTGGVFLVAVAVLLSSCNRDSLLGIETPDQITPGAAANAAGANAQRVAAIGNFATFYAGDVSGSGVGLAVASGLLSDEMESARGGTEHLDSRAQNESLFPVTSPWSFTGQAHTQLIRAIAAVEQFVPASTTRTTQVAELYALRGFVYILLAENYCSGIPMANANDATPATAIQSTAELLTQADSMFTASLATLGTQSDPAIRQLVAVGRARSQLDQGNYAAAGALVTPALVPTTFAYNITYSTTTIVNAMYDWMNATLNFAPADLEGGVGMNFVSANDPRVTVRRGTTGTPTPRSGQDGVNHFTQTVFLLANSPVPLASGVEARMIEAEAALQANDPATFLIKINDARASRAGLAAILTPPATRAAQEDLLFRERAFWFWGTAHRTGDLRRLMKAPYSRSQASVWPTGAYFKGGTFGADLSLRPAQAEQNNPAYSPAGCVVTVP